MLLYVIFTIIQCIVIILCLSMKTIYTQNFEYGKVHGVGSTYSVGNYNEYSMVEILGPSLIVICILVLAISILFLVLAFRKQFNIIPVFIFVITSLIPTVLMIVGTSIMSAEVKFIASSIAVYGSGVNSSFTNLGYFAFILSIASAFAVNWSFVKYKSSYDAKGIKKVKVIKSKITAKKVEKTPNTIENKTNIKFISVIPTETQNTKGISEEEFSL